MKQTETAGLPAMRVITRIFDELVRIPGTKQRIGLDALLGLLPGGGDLAGSVVSAYAILLAGRMGAPASVILMMALNIVIDALIGAIPLLGDLFDVGFKANRKNLDLLERYAAAPQATSKSSMLFVSLALLVVVLVLAGITWGMIWLLRSLF